MTYKAASGRYLRIACAVLIGVAVLVVVLWMAPLKEKRAIFIAGVCLSVSLLIVETWRMVQRKTRRLSGRSQLLDDELCATFDGCQLPAKELLEFLQLVALSVEMPRGLLRPTDRFSVELAPERGWEFDDGLSLLPTVLTHRFGGDDGHYNIEQFRTISELLKQVERQMIAQKR